MRNLIKVFIVLVAVLNLTFAGAFDVDFPKADENQTLHKIKLEPKEDESKFIVKYKFGKNMEVDCNIHFFTGLNFEKKELEGYGFEYYILSGDSSELASTMMLCENEKKSVKFIEFDPNLTLPYNSSLEQVFYTPKDISVKYEIYELVKTHIVEDE